MGDTNSAYNIIKLFNIFIHKIMLPGIFMYSGKWKQYMQVSEDQFGFI